MRKKQLCIAIALSVMLLILGAAIALAASRASPAAVAPGGIKGYLYEPNQVMPVKGGWIDIHDLEGQPWMGTSTAVDGYFEIPNLPPDIYILSAYPPPDPFPYAGSLAVEVPVFSGQWSEVNLFLTEVRISGWVQDSDTGDRIEGASVVAYDDPPTIAQWDVTNANGEFKIGGVEIGVTYNLEVLPPPETEYIQLPIHYTAVPITSNVVLEMHIPPDNVFGEVHDPIDQPVPGAGVVIFREDYWDETRADELGAFLFRGLPTGEFWLHAAPPWGEHGEGLMASEPFTIVITTPTTLVDVGVIDLLPAPKTVTGYVFFEGTTDGVPGAAVTAHRLDGPGFADTPTDPSGEFHLSLTGGEWHLSVDPLTPGVEWIFPGPPAWVVFPQDTVPQTDTVTLEVIPTNAWVTGRVVCPGGGVCVDEPPHEDIWVEVRNDDIRNGTELNPAYEFAIPIPDGWYELQVHIGHPEVQGPGPVPVFVGPGDTLNVGDIELLQKDASITGRVYDEFGEGVGGVRIAGWQPEGIGWGWAETEASGTYTMSVIAGEWFVEAQPGPELPYVLRQPPRLVRVASHGMISGVDFVLTTAEARIEGIAVDADSWEPIWGLDGGAVAELLVNPPDEFEFFTDAPLWDGMFGLKVKGGQDYNVGLNLPPHAPYVSGGIGLVPVPLGAHVPVEVPLEHKGAWIEGQLIDTLTGLPPTDPIWAEVFGEDERGHWVAAGVDPGTSGYGLGVVAGSWHLRTWVDPHSGYVGVPGTTQVTVQAGQGVLQNFEVWPINASISGQVREPGGAPLPGAFVYAQGESPFVGYFEAFAESDPSGNFELLVPEGTYMVGAALPWQELESRGWLNSAPIDVPWVSAAGPATGLELRFVELDGEINGAVSFAPGIVVTPTHPAYVWAWADTGEWAETEAHVVEGTHTFTYTMPVISDTFWHIGAVYEDWDNGVFYESPEETVPVLPPSGLATRDLELGGPWPLPQPFIVSFDGSQMQTIVMPDGTELVIPPGALVDSGTVTLFIFPTQQLQPEAGREIIGTGYEFWAVDQNGQEITQFKKNVVLTFQYPADAVLEANAISEHLLVPVYYSTLVGHWILADSYVVDTVNNEITLQISHFTKFGVAAPRPHHIYLPLVCKNY